MCGRLSAYVLGWRLEELSFSETCQQHLIFACLIHPATEWTGHLIVFGHVSLMLVTFLCASVMAERTGLLYAERAAAGMNTNYGQGLYSC